MEPLNLAFHILLSLNTLQSVRAGISVMRESKILISAISESLFFFTNFGICPAAAFSHCARNPGSRKPESGLQIDENHKKSYENHDKASLSSFRNMVLNFRLKSFAGLCLPFLKFQCFVF